ncbi:right-handed parallel beta-helix repeat-containing protein [Candidatus Neomarinimicrobiota bacterium]
MVDITGTNSYQDVTVTPGNNYIYAVAGENNCMDGGEGPNSNEATVLAPSSGIITGHRSWSGAMTLTGDVTVNANATLTVYPGAEVKFASGKKLTVNGTLTADGNSTFPITFTRSGTSGTWGGIRFEDTSVDASCIVKYADIEYATDGIYCNRAEPKIQHNTITNCGNGIYLYYASPAYVETNSIQNNTWGILGVSSSASIRDNLFRNNSGAGVSFSGGAPVFFDNSLKDNVTGAYFCGGSSPEFGPTSTQDKGNNVIYSNSYGIYANYYCDLFLGTLHPGARVRLGGYNSIYDNHVRDVTAYFYTDIEANYNWWGTTPVILVSYGSSIDDDYPLTSKPPEPPGGSSLGKAIVVAGNTDIWADFDPNNPDYDSLHDLWLLGHYYFINDKLTDAIETYHMLVNKFSGDEYANRALVKIYHLYRKTEKEGFTDYLNGLLTNSRIDENVHPILYMLLVNAYLDDKDVISAAASGETIMNSFDDSFTEKLALYYLALASLNDSKLPTDYTELMRQKYPHDALTYMAREAAGEKISWSLDKLAGKSEIIESSLPESFALHAAYPNPFNPNTTLSYDLPSSAKLSLVIYDVAGRRIAGWSAHKEAGSYHQVWAGKDDSGKPLPSGVYLYRLVARPTDGSAAFTETRKMLLLK